MSRKKVQISELDLKKVGGRIAYIRLLKDQNQDQFSSNVGISKGNLSGLENHKYEPSFQLIVKILEHYQVNSGWLLLGEGEISFDETCPTEGHSQKPGVYKSRPVLKENPELKIIEDEHSDLVKNFKDKVTAKDVNEKLIDLEYISEKTYRRVVNHITDVWETAVDIFDEMEEKKISDNGNQKNGTDDK